MNQADVKVSFYLKKSEADAKGNCPRNGKVECRQVLRGGIQCETVGTTYDVALRSCYG